LLKREKKMREKEERGRGREERGRKEKRTYGTRSSAEDYWILLSKINFNYLNN
jgi:hypothetical protein